MMAATSRTGHPPVSRKSEILAAATHLFAGQGFDGTPMRAIAKACGVTEAAIYRHFDNKEHLYEEVVRSKSAEHNVAARLAECGTTGDVESMLTRVAEYILAFSKADPELLQLMANGSRASDSAAMVLFHEIRLPIIDFIRLDLEQRIARGEVRPVDTLITARCFVGMVMDCAMCFGVWARLNSTIIQSRDVVANNVPIFARGLKESRSHEAAQPGSRT